MNILVAEAPSAPEDNLANSEDLELQTSSSNENLSAVANGNNYYYINGDLELGIRSSNESLRNVVDADDHPPSYEMIYGIQLTSSESDYAPSAPYELSLHI